MNMTKKFVGIVICLLMVFATIFPVTGTMNKSQMNEEEQIRIDFMNTLYVGGSGPGNYSTIQEAIDAAQPGDTVFVYDDASPYHERITVNKAIVLQGEDKETTIIDRQSVHGVVVSITADNVHFSGFTVQATGGNDSGGGIVISANYVEIVNANIYGAGFVGVSIESDVHDTLITRNTIDGNGWYGIFLRGYANTITHNIINNNGWYGICASDSIQSLISDNIFTYNGWYGICYLNGNNNTISRNVFMHNVWYGIYISDANDNVISENSFSFEHSAIIMSSGHNNWIYHNNFITAIVSNSGSNHWDNGYPSGGNYWSNYQGTDLYHGPNQDIPGSDGIGDTPKSISGGGQDQYPLMHPFISGDLDYDGDIDYDDYVIFLSAFGYSVGQPEYNIRADLDNDGMVTLVDYQLWWQCYRDYIGDPQAPLPHRDGDLNGDGLVNFDDINPFVLRLSNPAQYKEMYMLVPDANGDINDDDRVDFGDINPFIALLTGSS